MKSLQFHTRANVKPHGKSGVYFTAHPDDAGEYLREIEQDILYSQDCVFWFDPETHRQIDDDFLLELSFMNMQLMVIPVTKKLLTQPNRVTEKELPFALKHHIPILPIMVEPGLDGLYKPVFSDLQYLSKVVKDTTSIPYEQKLEKFLDSVLVGNETAKRIKAAFDALIFLSYRKKDRALAQELMDLIHRVPQLQAVGIWYDEFLVPGEGFNGGIRDAIDECHLFVLTVTPNLINEDNFIRENEYKWARVDYKKDIVPVQMEVTDWDTLCRCFEAIPHVVDAHCQEALGLTLQKALKKKLITGERGPVHTYLMGLAYLHGINMETNQERGKDLIIAAANQGLLEAKEKLVQMYFRGYGVERDYGESIRWQAEVVEAYRQRYVLDPSEKNWCQYAWELSYLGDDLVQMHRWDEAVTTFETAQSVFGEQLQKQESLKYRERFVYIRRELALAYQQTGDTNTAIKTLHRALKAAQCVPEADASLLLRRYHAQLLCDLGVLYQETGHCDKALPYCLDSLQLAKRILEEDDGNNSRHLVALASYYLGGLYCDYGNWKEAEQFYATAIFHMGKIINSMPQVDEMLFLGECLRAAGEYYEMRGKFTEAEDLYSRSLRTFEMTMEVCQTEQVQQMLERALRALESLRISRNGQQGNLRPRFVKAADDRAAADDCLQNQLARADAHRSWANACSRGGNFQKAHTCFRKAIRLYDDLWQHTLRPHDACALCTARMDLVESLRRSDQWEQMPELLSEVNNTCEQALKMEDLPELRRELARSWVYRGRFYMHLEGRFYETALDCYLEALPLFEQLIQNTNHFHMLLFRAECKIDIAECYLHIGNGQVPQPAVDYSKEAVEEIEAIHRAAPTKEATKCLKKCYEIRATILYCNDQRQEALHYFTETHALLPQLEDQYNASEYQYQCAQMLYFKGEIIGGKQGERHLKEARRIMEALYKMQPYNGQYKKTLGLILYALHQLQP